ncbi:FAD-dependent oxidoreductase [Sinomonas sp. P47F7]|uniref:FAD-dependent oxidoreductase n=1 Tax=Sinomonas sp. P47F7 TaxID=3410987 RepID=UPI003BF5E308
MIRRTEVAVIGAGVAGTLVTVAAVSRGMDVTWVAPHVSPEDQSAHWHGYIHRGRLYHPEQEANLIQELEDNWRFWNTASVRRFHQPIETFALSQSRRWAWRFAERVGENVVDGVAPGVLEGIASVPSGERVLDGPAFLGHARLLLENSCACLNEMGSRIERIDGNWLIATNSGHKISARNVIVATGSGASSLLTGVPEIHNCIVVRRSRMLVLRGSLPAAALIWPSKDAGGLFLVSRTDITGESGVWLVSDNFSTPGIVATESLVDGWWACSIAQRLMRFISPDLLLESRISAYTAEKTHLRANEFLVPARGTAADSTGTLVCLAPAKWSTAASAAATALSIIGRTAYSRRETYMKIAEFLTPEIREAPSKTPTEAWQMAQHSVPFRRLIEEGWQTVKEASGLFAR